VTKELENLSDESLVERVKNHDHQAFSVLVTRHSEKFYFSSYRYVMNQQEAEDIVQDAFLKLWDRPEIWKSGKGAKFTSWFYKIVMNLSLDKCRKYKKTIDVDDAKDLQVDGTQFEDLQKTEEQKTINEALKALPEKQMIALNLCFYEEMSRKEAAVMMKISVKALESLLMRGKAKLKDELYREGFIAEKQKGNVG
jgi:RNA polymerase sigma-70 factor (ECF subfamily)